MSEDSFESLSEELQAMSFRQTSSKTKHYRRMRQAINAMHEEMFDRTERLSNLKAAFVVAIRRLAIENDALEEKEVRLSILERKLREPERHASHIEVHSNGEFSFSNLGTEEAKSFSYTDTEENAGVAEVYKFPNQKQKTRTIQIPFIYRKYSTTYEMTKDIPILIGEVLAERFRIERIIATTHSASVIEVFDTAKNYPVALKIINNSKPDLDSALSAIRVYEYLKENSEVSLSKKFLCDIQEYFYYRVLST